MIDAIRSRVNKGTLTDLTLKHDLVGPTVTTTNGVTERFVVRAAALCDANLFVHARTDIQHLLALVEQLQSELAQKENTIKALRSELKWFTDNIPMMEHS